MKKTFKILALAFVDSLCQVATWINILTCTR